MNNKISGKFRGNLFEKLGEKLHKMIIFINKKYQDNLYERLDIKLFNWSERRSYLQLFSLND